MGDAGWLWPQVLWALVPGWLPGGRKTLVTGPFLSSSDSLLSHVEQLLRAFILKISVCDAVLDHNPPGGPPLLPGLPGQAFPAPWVGCPVPWAPWVCHSCSLGSLGGPPLLPGIPGWSMFPGSDLAASASIKEVRPYRAHLLQEIFPMDNPPPLASVALWVMPFFLLFLKVFILLSERQSYRELERAPPLVHFPKWLQQPELGQAEAGATSKSHTGSRGPCTGPSAAAFLGPLAGS